MCGVCVCGCVCVGVWVCVCVCVCVALAVQGAFSCVFDSDHNYLFCVCVCVCVCVALAIQGAKRMRRIILLSVVCLAVIKFDHIVS